MSKTAIVKGIIEQRFKGIPVRETENGLKLNVQSLEGDGFKFFAGIQPTIKDLKIKRSGTGLVILIKP